MISRRVAIVGVGGAACAAAIGYLATPAAVRLIVRGEPSIIMDDIPTRTTLERYAEESARTAEDRRVAALIAGEFVDLLKPGVLPHYLGDRNLKRTVIEFCDYSDPACRKMEPQLRFAASATLSALIYIPFPTNGLSSELASRTALAVYREAPASFNSFHTQLMSQPVPTDVASMSAIARSAGVPDFDLADAIGDPFVIGLVDRSSAFARAVGVRSLPSILINNRVHQGAMGSRRLRDLIENRDI